MSVEAEAAILTPARAESRVAPDRLLFIDNIRWVMILLVLAMHAAVTYSPFGGWYYRERHPLDFGSLLFFATFQAFLQGFFMALLFFIAGYFTPQSYDRKGAAGFLAGRITKLGLPTLLFIVAIGPVTEYFIAGSWHTKRPFGEAILYYFAHGQFLGGTGPLWFCAALLIFSIVYLLYRLTAMRPTFITSLPGAWGVALAILVMALATFLVRVPMPVGTSFYNMQLCYFASYIIMFALGIAAYRGRWLDVSDAFAWRAAAICIGFALVSWGPFLAFGGAVEGKLAPYNGGLTWQSGFSSLWEALVCVGMAFAVIAAFRAWIPAQGPIARFLSANAFAVYVIHPPLLVLLTLALAGLALPAVTKFLILWVLAALFCFGIAAPLARRIPVLGRILQ